MNTIISILIIVFLARYFSENALLPGLVRGEFNEDILATKLQEELQLVQQANPGSIPYSWLRAQFSKMHLDSYLHNYTLEYPLAANGVCIPWLLLFSRRQTKVELIK